MSLIGSLKSDFSNLPDIISKYEQELEGFERYLSLEGKSVVQANTEQPAWLSYYDQRKIELYSLVKFLDAKVQSIRGSWWKHFNEQYSRELNHRDKENYINCKPEYLSIYELYLELHELYDKYASVVKAFDARGFALRNITDLKVHALHDSII